MSKPTTLSKPTPAKTTSAAVLAFAEAGSEANIATTRLNANIPVELHRALKIRAVTEGVTIGELVENWIKSWVKK